jgi:HK97 family phage portal protein
MTTFTFIETVMSHLCLWGNSYSQIIRNGRGMVVALYPLLPSQTDVNRDEYGNLTYTYLCDDGKVVTLQKRDVLHIPGLGFDGLIGYSPIAMAKNAVGLSLATEEYGAKFFENGANPGGVLEHPGTLSNPEKLRKSWNKQYQGTKNSHHIAVLEEGLKFHSVGVPPNEAQFLETRNFQLEEIARIYRVPLHMIGDLNHATFSNIEQMSLEFVKFTLSPWIRRIETALEKALLNEYERNDYFIRFNVDGLLRGDYKSRSEGYAIGIQNGWLSVNDVRQFEDMNLLSDDLGGNLHFLNGNVVKLQDAGIAYADKATENTDNKTENNSGRKENNV